MTRPRVLLADDQRLIREAIARLLEAECEVVAAVADGPALLAAAAETRPDIALIDVSMPGLDGLTVGRQLLHLTPDVKVILLTPNEDPDLAAEAFRMGASGLLLKQSSSAELLQAVREVSDGKTYISPLATKGVVEVLLRRSSIPAKPAELSSRQKEVLRLLVGGLTMKEIARSLDITPRTVAFHKYRMMEVLGLGSSAELIQYAVSHRITNCQAT